MRIQRYKVQAERVTAQDNDVFVLSNGSYKLIQALRQDRQEYVQKDAIPDVFDSLEQAEKAAKKARTVQFWGINFYYVPIE